MSNRISRRDFIRTSVKGAGLIALGGVIGETASRLSGSTGDAGTDLGSDDLRQLSAIDPALVKYREAGKIDMGFKALQAVAVSLDDRIYVAADKTIQIFDNNADRLWELKLGDSPRCLTVDEDGTIYVGMKDRVEIYNQKGELKTKWSDLEQNAVLTSIAVSEGNVFVADAGNRMVLRYDTSGRIMRRIGKRDRNIPGFSVPSPYFDLAISPDGLLRVANPGQHRVEAYTFDGDFELSWGNPSMGISGFCGCCNPVNFTILPDGKFATCEKGLPRVKVYEPNGDFSCVVAGPETFAKNSRSCSLNGLLNCRTGGLDIAADSRGRILVMDPVESVVRIFTKI